MHVFFGKYRGALIGACVLIRTNMVFGIHRKKIFLLYTIHGHFPIHKAGLENEKQKKMKKKKKQKKKKKNKKNKKKKNNNNNNFGTTLFLTF